MRIRLSLALFFLTVGSAAFVSIDRQKLKHLALPTVTPLPEQRLAADHPLIEQLGAQVERVASVGRRISGLSVAPDGTVWIGLFDGGVALLPPGEPRAQEVPGLTGRERFVSAIQVHGGKVYAASYAGILELAFSGKRERLHLEGTAADGLSLDGDRLIAATGRGAFALNSAGAFTRFEEVVADGTPLRVISLSSNRGALWYGTPRGLYRHEGQQVRWFPLVFGSPGAQTNVVTAVAAFREGAIAGTDDGGLAWISNDGEVRAARFGQSRANEINPGAALALNDCALFGTQGAGLLAASATRFGAVARIGPAVQVSAVTRRDDGRLLLGTSEGELLSVRLPGDLCAAPLATRP